MLRPRVLLAVAACVCALLVMLVPSSAWARSRGPKVSASFVAVGSEVDAGGIVGVGSVRGAGSRGRWKAVLQQRVGSRWLTRATSGLHAHGRASGFSLKWAGAAPGSRMAVRVEITSGRVVVAHSAAHSMRSSSPVSVQSTLRASTVQPSAGAVLSLSGSPGGASVVVLARGARVPAVGGALVLNVSANAPSGLLGVVTAVSRSSDGSTRVTTRPGTLEDAYSSFDAHLNGELGQLLEQGATTASVRGHAAVNLGVFNTSFGCDDPSVQKTIMHSIDLSAMHVSAYVVIPSYSNGYYGPGVDFALFGHPKLNFGVTFSGSQKCEAKATVKIPIPDTPGLFVEIGPDFTLSGNGSVGVSFTWEPWVNYGFTRFRGGPNGDEHEFRNGGSVQFTGAAELKLSLALDAGISLAGHFGVRGSLGPEVTGQVSTQTSPPQTCLTVNADFAANLTAYADVFFKDYTFNIASATFGPLQLYPTHCTNTGGGGSGGGGSGGGGGPGGGGGSGGGGPGGGGGGGSGSPTPGTWTSETPALPSNYSGNLGLISVSCLPSHECVGVGSYTTKPTAATAPLVERWNGSMWAVEEVPSPLGSEVTQLKSVSCTSASSCVAIGSSQTNGPIAEVWNGAHWDLFIPPHYGPQSDGLDGVSCVSAMFCEAVGTYTDAEGYEHTLAMNWNGSTWSVQSAADPTPPGPNANNSLLNGVSCTSETACVAVGSYWDKAENRELTLAERWNGSDWSLETPPNPDPTGDFQNYLTSVSCIGPSTCVAVGTYNSNTGSLYYTSSGIIADNFNGSTWTMQNPPNAGGAENGDFNKVSCASATFCLATTALFGPIYEWNGSSWTGSESTLSEVGASISCASETYCMAVGEDTDLYSG